jgi:uncharacterized protein (TIGR00251 family)
VVQAGDWYRHVSDDLLIHVRVQPRASRNEILGVRDGRLRLRTTAPPADGKASKAVIRLLADFLDVAPSRISLVRGTTHRDKQLRVLGPVEIAICDVHDDVANGL